jgi:hypothetical protein
VIFLSLTSGIIVNTVGVVNKSVRVCDRAGDRSSLVDLIHHGQFASDSTELLDLVDIVLVGNEAGIASLTITAQGHGTATNSIVVTSTLVNRASLISDVVVVDVLVTH